MSDVNSSSDEESVVVGHLFDDDESGSESSSEEYESSSEEPLGLHPMIQGPQHLASDPRYFLRYSIFCQKHMTDNWLEDL